MSAASDGSDWAVHRGLLSAGAAAFQPGPATLTSRFLGSGGVWTGSSTSSHHPQQLGAGDAASPTSAPAAAGPPQCHFFARGRCHNGLECPFRHDPVVHEPAAPPVDPNNPRTRFKRAKQIEYGKVTEEYARYLAAVPIDARHPSRAVHPRTPDLNRRCSKRTFDGLVKAWRKDLHRCSPRNGIFRAWDGANPPAQGEKRIDPADGNAYTRQDFIDCYGGTVQWGAASPLPQSEGAAQSDSEEVMGRGAQPQLAATQSRRLAATLRSDTDWEAALAAELAAVTSWDACSHSPTSAVRAIGSEAGVTPHPPGTKYS